MHEISGVLDYLWNGAIAQCSEALGSQKHIFKGLAWGSHLPLRVAMPQHRTRLFGWFNHDAAARIIAFRTCGDAFNLSQRVMNDLAISRCHWFKHA
jgi:hypothetical protein